MKLIDLFSGIGGFSLAAHWMRWQTVAFVEKDEFCQKVLAKNFPGVSIYGDIHDFKGERDSADIICGGFPCQPFSVSGRRNGTDDNRYLWPEMLRVIREVRPRYVVGENVHGLLSWSGGMVFETVCADLEAAGYEIWPGLLPACSIGAQTRRDRVWIIGHLPDAGRVRCSQRHGVSQGQQSRNGWSAQRVIDPLYRDASRNYWRNESSFTGVVDGIPDRMDRVRSYGNSIVPQLAYRIFKAIEDAEGMTAALRA